MGFFALLFMPFRVVMIFAGFTFTDAVDFGPVLCLVLGLIGGVFVCRSPQKKVSPLFAFLMILLSVWPLLPNIGLYFMAREFQAVRGSWPKWLIDDPKLWSGRVSPRFETYEHLTNYLEAYSGAWMVAFLTLFFTAYSRFSRMQRRVYVSLTFLCLFLVMLDPGGLYAWWMD